jgi:pimeloyl-ACP methyl ester carboxylesterase
VVLDPASHLSNLEQPEVFTKALQTFLSRVA